MGKSISLTAQGRVTLQFDPDRWPRIINIWVHFSFGILAYTNRSVAWTGNQIIGMAIAAPSLCLWVTALLQLGKSFAVSAEAKELVTHG